MSVPSQPERFGDYLLMEEVASGGMAEVFRAVTFGVEGFRRQVAIKRILSRLAKDDTFVGMLIDEARIAVRLSHPHIVQTYELGKVSGQYFIAMEYVAGLDLRNLLTDLNAAGEMLPIPLAVYIISSICSALDHAHRQNDTDGTPLNIVHRDVSPQNVLIGYGGDVKLSDFGIARAENRVTQTQVGTLKGKFAYMAPEQVRGGQLTRATDIFALGSLLFETLTGRQMFDQEEDFSVLEAVRNADTVSPRDVRPDVPEELERIIHTACAPTPAERFSHASDLADALEPFLIDGNTIVGSRSLIDYLTPRYAEAIELERLRLEKISVTHQPDDTSPNVPTAEVPFQEAKTHVLAAASGTSWRQTRRATESEFDAVSDAWALADATATQRNTALTQPVPAVAVTQTSNAAAVPEPLPPRRRSLAPVAVFATLLVAAGGIAAWMALSGGGPSHVDEAPPRTGKARHRSKRQKAAASAGKSTGSAARVGAVDKRPPEPPAAVTRSDVEDLRRTVDRLIRRNGIIAGDLPEVDSQRAKMNAAVKKGNLVAATSAGGRALSILKRFSINNEFIGRKLERFNRQFDRVKDAGVKKKLTAHADRIGASMAAGELANANRELNGAFRTLQTTR